MALSSFCGLLTLQVGCCVLSAVFVTLAAVILAANIFDFYYHDEGWPVPLMLMILFVIGLLIIAVLIFASSYTESRSLAMGAVIVTIILFCYWIILCCFSLVSNPDHINSICIMTRCPETFWIANLAYRRHRWKQDPGERRGKRSSDEDDNDIVRYSDLLLQGVPLSSYIIKNESHKRSVTQAVPKNTNVTETDPAQPYDAYEEDSRYIVGVPFVGAILLFILNVCFLLFSAFMMWSWASELDWADYYIEDEPEPVYVVEETY